MKIVVEILIILGFCVSAYLKEYDYNIIIVDWSKEAHSMYQTARKDVPAVGHTVALFIDKLAHQTGLRLAELHLVGHSLGAHISGVAGLSVKSGRIMRVTGENILKESFPLEDSVSRVAVFSASTNSLQLRDYAKYRATLG